MADVLTADASLVVPFVCDLAGIHEPWLDDPSAIGLIRDGELVAGVLYEHYTGSSLEMHVAGTGGRWATRRFLREVFHYPFVQLGCKIVYGRVPSWRPEALRLDLGLGFKIDHILKDATPTGDMYVISMRPQDCKFLEVRHGQ